MCVSGASGNTTLRQHNQTSSRQLLLCNFWENKGYQWYGDNGPITLLPKKLNFLLKYGYTFITKNEMNPILHRLAENY